MKGSLKINQDFCAVNVGTNQFVGDGCFIRVNNDPLFSLGLGEHGGLELSITLYDRDDSLLAIIEKNEWISGDPLPWDIESSHQRLKIRRRTGDIAMEINARRMPINMRADLWKGGQNICLHDDILVDGLVVENVKFRSLCFVGIHLVIDTVPRTFHLVPDARFGQGALVSWPDPAERIEKGRIAWLNLQSQGIRQQR